MRNNIRIKIRNINIFFSISQVQTLEGITSTVKRLKNDYMNSEHVIFWDLENCSLEDAIVTLRKVKHDYILGPIYLLADINRSYRALCFDTITFHTFIRILLDTRYVDPLFFYYTVKRREATIRTARKRGRPKPAIINIIKDKGELDFIPEIVKKLSRVIYDTGLTKKGATLEVVHD